MHAGNTKIEHGQWNPSTVDELLKFATMYEYLFDIVENQICSIFFIFM